MNGWTRITVGALATALACALGTPAPAAPQGGTLRVDISKSDVTSLDPALDYEYLGWGVLWATCAKLVSYPDKPAPLGAQLIPEVAAGLPRVSANGRTYTFAIRSGYRFNTGEPVTAQNFVRAFERDFAPAMASPAVDFISDVVGAPAALKGRVKLPSGIKASGNTLSITLVAPAPDLLARLAMPFFCAVPGSTPIDPRGVTPAMAGPYYIAQRIPNRSIVLKQNPYYHGPRPHNVAEIDFTPNTDEQTSFLEVEKDQVDYDIYGTPPAVIAGLARKYGINRGRFWVHPGVSVIFAALNTSRPPFNDVRVRRAANFALSREGIMSQAGFEAGTPTDQILPRSMRGFRDARIYPLTVPDIARAKALMGGRTVKATLYTTTDQTASEQAQVVQANLARIGITVTIKQYSFGVLNGLTSVTSTPYDMVLSGWIADYADPYDFINVLLDGNNIRKSNNPNVAQLKNPTFDRRMEQAALIVGQRRYTTYGKLDVDISRDAAPWASLYNLNIREFLSSRVGCYTFQPVLGEMDLAATCIK